MKLLLMMLTVVNMYNVKWENDYFDIELYDNVVELFDLPQANLYDSNNKLIDTPKSYLKGVNRTSLSVVNSNHVKTFKIDYRVYFYEYNIQFDHTITFNIVDTKAPTILSTPNLTMLIGSKPLTEKEILNSVTYKDNYYKNEELTLRIHNLNLVNNKIVGKYKIIYELVDPSNNIHSLESYYEVINDNYPVVKYNEPIILDYGKEFIINEHFKISDPGDISLKIDLDLSRVNFSKTGTYPVYLKVTNNGNLTTIVDTTIKIVDNIKPTIILTNNQVLNVNTYNDEILKSFIYSIKDNYDDKADLKVDIIHQIDFNKIDKYEVTYEVTDTNNNSTTKKLVVEIKDLEKPTILELKDLNIVVNSLKVDYYNYFDFFDNFNSYDELIISFNEKLINYNILGIYSLEVSVTDTSKNSYKKRFNVSIVDTIPPEVTKMKDIIINDYNYKENSFFKNYFNITDNYDKYKDISISLNEEINFNVIGINVITFIFSDTSNNITSIELEVYIIDDLRPELILSTDKININQFEEIDNINMLLLKVSDNYNEKEELILNIINEIDYSKIGIQYLFFELSDTSLNKTTKNIKVIIDKKYEQLINGNNITINQNDNIILGQGIIFSESVDKTLTFPSKIDTSTAGNIEVLFIAYDIRGNYEEYIQNIEILPNKENNLKDYFPVIIINVLIISYIIYIIYKDKKYTNFEN